MSVKIRLQRHGKKQKPFYWIVATDARSKRDGRYLEKLGTYNPNTNPAKVELNLDQAVQWLHNGAQPTDTARAILSYKGALLKHHLDGGIRKGALTQEQADAKLASWLESKSGKVDAKKEGLTKKQSEAKAKALKAEVVANQKRVNAIAEATKALEAPEVVEEIADETPIVEEIPAEEVITETPVAEAPEAESPVVDETPSKEDNTETTEA
ncbi:MAG: 30S ribosomal protein S16 [Flavobacterium sp.]|nr:30S ribosomal protein S16 [Flavobacterium sp.]